MAHDDRRDEGSRSPDDLDFSGLRDLLDRPIALPIFLFAVASLFLFWTLPDVSLVLLEEESSSAFGLALAIFTLSAGLVAALGARSLLRRPSFRWQRILLLGLSTVGVASGIRVLAGDGIDLFFRVRGLDWAFAAGFIASFATGLLLLELAWPEREPGSP